MNFGRFALMVIGPVAVGAALVLAMAALWAKRAKVARGWPTLALIAVAAFGWAVLIDRLYLSLLRHHHPVAYTVLGATLHKVSALEFVVLDWLPVIALAWLALGGKRAAKG